MTEILQNLLSKSDLLIVFLGMFALVWRSLSIAHDLSKLALQKAPDQPAKPPAAPVVSPSKPTPASPVVAPAPTEPPAGVVVDQGLIAAVKKFEGFRAKAFGDFKQFSIGFGTRANSPDEVITEAEGEKRLIAELGHAQQAVESFAPGAPLGVKQALTDLTYNVGTVWQQQGLGQLIKAGSYEEAKARILQYNHAGGEVLAGLTTRREAEVSWFDHPL